MGFAGSLFLLLLDAVASAATKIYLFPMPRIIEMIEKNTAGQTVGIGPLLNVTTGAAVTSGSISTRIGGVTAAGAGTLTHISSGCFEYSPTQAETNTGSLILILTGSGAAPVELTITPTSYSADVAAITAKTNTIGSGTITVTSPLRAGGGLTLIRGDDYSDANGVPLTWTDTGSRWATLVGSTISLVIQEQTFAGTVVDADTLKVQLTAAQTSGLSPSSVTVPTYVYYVRQTNGAGKVTTLARGLVTINDPGIA